MKKSLALLLALAMLIGVLAATLTIPKEDWVEALKKTVPPKFLELNLKAFELGYSLK